MASNVQASVAQPDAHTSHAMAGSAQAVDTPNDAHCRSATSARALLPSPWPATLRGG